MKLLKDLLYGVKIESVLGQTDIPVLGLASDSRKAEKGFAFIAIKGFETDGHQFIDKAIEKGATAIVAEKLPKTKVNGVTYVEVADSRLATALMADIFFNKPSDRVKVIGVTGTNGKTTFATLSHQLFQKAGFSAGLISTIKIVIDGKHIPATHTTPDSIQIQHYLSQMAEAGVNYCFMEVSSHGIDQKRAHGIRFFGGVFTNLTHDHLDYHKTFSAYRDVKKQFFDLLPKSAFALSNADDKNGDFMLQNTKAKKYTYALKAPADFKARVLENRLEGLVLKINHHEVYTQLIGRFNAYNLTAITATALLCGLDEAETLRLVSELETAPGRFQHFVSDNGVILIVDYAHTPDALQNVLETLSEIRTHNETLIGVVGCGGNRDPFKRPLMAQIATSMCDTAIFTNDNPRFEDPETILDDMEKGVEPQHYRKYLRIADRYQAIKTACQMANKGDIVLIAGKGHETYQEIKGVKNEFDDMKIARKLLTHLNPS